MLSAIVQKATGETVLDFLQPRLFQPLDIERPAWETSPQGISTGGYGLSIRTEDTARFGQLYLQKGRWQGKQLVPETWSDVATSLQTSNGSNPNSDWDQGYGYQFRRCRHGAYRGDEAFGQYCIVLPQQDAVIATTSGLTDMQSVFDLVWDKLLPAMSPSRLPSDGQACERLVETLRGLTVLLIEGRGQLGGMATSGMVSQWLGGRNQKGEWVVGGRFRSITEEADSQGYALLPTLDPGKKYHPFGWFNWFIHGVPIDPYGVARFLDAKMKAFDIDVLLLTQAVDVLTRGDRITHMVAFNKSGLTTPLPYGVMVPHGIRNPICPGRAVCVEQQVLGPVRVMAPCMAMDEASGIDVFLFDWYWYSGVKTMQEALEQGFLRAENRDRMKFALMWANHDRVDQFCPDFNKERTVWMPSRHSPHDLERVVDYCIEHYFCQPNYWSVDGRLFFSVYQATRFVEELSGPLQTHKLLEKMDGRLERAHLPPMHWNGMVSRPEEAALVREAGFRSTSKYNVLATSEVGPDLTVSYEDVMVAHRKHWQKMSTAPLVNLPVVTVGWDATPRCRRDIPWSFPIPPWTNRHAYPYCHLVVGNTPERFEQLLHDAAEHIEQDPRKPFAVLVNAWNEWTEGCYLLPEEWTGTARLEAIRPAFPR
jgi:hypothetical protein